MFLDVRRSFSALILDYFLHPFAVRDFPLTASVSYDIGPSRRRRAAGRRGDAPLGSRMIASYNIRIIISIILQCITHRCSGKREAEGRKGG